MTAIAADPAESIPTKFQPNRRFQYVMPDTNIDLPKRYVNVGNYDHIMKISNWTENWYRGPGGAFIN